MQQIHPIKLSNNTTITDPERILDAWKEYYQELYGDGDNHRYVGTFKKRIEEKIDDLLSDANVILDDVLRDDLSMNEVRSAINSMKNGKAPGPDHITAECI